MKAMRLRILAAALAALLALGMLPAALAEEEVYAELPEEIAGEWQEDAVFDGAVDPEAGLATDAGDTGLTVDMDYGEPAPELSQDETALPASDAELPEAVEADLGSPEEAWAGEGLILAPPEVSAGYFAVAADTALYSDAGLTQPVGRFTGDSTVYVFSVEAEGAALRVRFDTDQARAWGQEPPTGYLDVWQTLAYGEAESAALIEALSAQEGVRWADGLPVPVAAWEALESGVLAEAAADGAVTGLNVDAHSAAEIQAFVDAHPAYRSQVNLYSVAASDEPYTLGYLSPVNQQSALNLLNQIRYIVGVDANVVLDSSREFMVSATSLVLRLNGGLSHYPVRPAALLGSEYDRIYAQGYAGAGSSNIAMGYTATSAMLGGVSATTATQRGYMADADSKNMATVGHRRWIINPRMGKTFFGANGRFSAMYAHDQSNPGGQTKVAWPAQNMPVQYFSAIDPWSVSFGRVLDASQLSVTLVRAGDGKTWSFSQAQSDGYFNVDNSGYGQRGCVIFKPDGLIGISAGDVFTVTINDGKEGEVTQYNVNFFSLNLSAAQPLSRLEVSAVKRDDGNAINWSFDERATGYYVCRRTADSLYQIVADVNGTAYLDTTASPDTVYTYQVYAHNDSVTSATATAVQALPPEPESMTLSASGTVKLYTNATLQVTAAYVPSYAETTLSWYSTDESVAVVDANGLVMPVGKGTAYINATTSNGLAASFKVKVAVPPKPKKVKLDQKGTVKLNLGETLQLNATMSPDGAYSKLSWKSSDKRIARVSSSGLVTPKKAGTVTVTVKTANGKSAKVKVKVIDPTKPTKVQLAEGKSLTVKVDETVQLNALLSPDTAVSKLTWKSANKKVAKVNGDGEVTALRRGTAKITVTTKNGKKATIKIKVEK